MPYSKIVNAAFAYPGPAGARLHGPRRGAWYVALAVSTSLTEVAFHRSVHLAETGWWHDVADYQDYLADIRTEGVADLTDGDARAEPCLDPGSYAAGQELAARLLGDGAAGVLYPSVRDPEGVCVAVFRPALVSHVRPGGRYRLEWNGTPEPSIAPLV